MRTEVNATGNGPTAATTSRLCGSAVFATVQHFLQHLPHRLSSAERFGKSIQGRGLSVSRERCAFPRNPTHLPVTLAFCCEWKRPIAAISRRYAAEPRPRV